MKNKVLGFTQRCPEAESREGALGHILLTVTLQLGEFRKRWSIRKVNPEKERKLSD